MPENQALNETKIQELTETEINQVAGGSLPPGWTDQDYARWQRWVQRHRPAPRIRTH